VFTSLCAKILHHTRVVNGLHFETRTRPEITSPNPARVRHLFLKPDLGLKAKSQSKDIRNCEISKNVVYGYSWRYTVLSHPK